MSYQEFTRGSGRCNMFEMDLGELFANPSGNGDTAVYTEVSPVHPGESEIVKLLLKQLVKLKARGAYRPSFTLSIIYCVRDTESTWLRLYGDVSWSVNDVNDAWRAALTKQEELTEQTVPVTEQQLATAAA